MKLEEIDEVWFQDALELSKEENAKQNSIRLPLYNSKYLNILGREESRLSLLEKEYSHLRMLKHDIITEGAKNHKELEADPDLPHRMVKSKSEADVYLDGNAILSEIKLKMDLCRIKISKLKSIIASISNLSWDYKNFVSIKLFENGSR